MNTLSELPESDLADLAAFLSDEDIIAKSQAIQQVEHLHPYQRLKDPSATFWTRLMRAADDVPGEHQLGLVALASNVIYLPTHLVEGSFREQARALRRRLDCEGISNADCHVLAVDDPGLIGELYRLGDRHGFVNRLDHSQEADFHTLKQLMVALLGLVDGLNEPQARQLAKLFQKRAWIFLTDNALSGTSVASDLKRAGKLLEMFAPAGARPKILVCAKIITSQARRRLGEADVPPHELLKGIEFDDRFRINDPVYPGRPNMSCALFYRESTLERVRRFCEWFGESHFSAQRQLPLKIDKEGMLDDPDPFERSLEEHRKRGCVTEFVYGWADTGLTLVLETNCPNNSVPPLWFPDLENSDRMKYSAPYPRSSSRQSYAPSAAAALFANVIEKGNSIAEAVRNLR